MDRVKDVPLAVVGMACRLPGADNLDQFWQLLIDGRCAIVEAPPDRLDRQRYYDPHRGIRCKTYISKGGMIQYHPFDSLRCPVPRRILPSSEIGHQTICQVAADACRHAGMNPFDLPLRNVGVYVGYNLGGPVAGKIVYGTMVEQTAQYLREIDAFRRVAGGQMDDLIEEVVAQVRDDLPRLSRHGGTKSMSHMAAAIISEALGLTGPAMVLDAACSSALQGLAMASRALQLGRIDMAIVGGASYFHVDSLMLFSAAQSASSRGSFPFDADADGLVSSEGYASIIVKTLDRALADGDSICCVVRGIGVSSDGRGKSLWAPRKEGQVLAIQRAYENGLDIGRLQYIEAHATSTAVGDLTEMKALAEVLGGHVPAGVKIPMGGVKANIGHTLETAGLAGLIKTVLAMRHKTIPRQIHLSRLNPGIDWETAPFFVPTSNIPWPAFADGHPRRAAVNSFGIGGLNVHIVIDEYKNSAATPRSWRRRFQPATAAPLQESIAIIGAGCIFPGARTLDAFWELVVSGRDPKCDVPADRWNVQIGYEAGSCRPWRSPSKRGGFITDFKYDWRRHKIPPNQVAHADPLQLMILDAADAALADAGYDQKPYDKSRVGVVVGTMFGGDFSDQLQMGFRLPDFCDKLAAVLRSRGVAEDEISAIGQAYGDVLLKHMTALLDQTGGFTPSALASRITKIHNFMGGAATIDSGQASSLAALGSAIDNLLVGSCDMVLCAAGHRAMGLPTYEWLALNGNLADDQPKSPFDADANGYLPGEGVGVLVLKRLADAQRDGDRIRGIIRGIGAGFSSSCREAVGDALQRAYQAAGVTPGNVTLLETSGVGQAEVDHQEIAAVADRLTPLERREPLILGSVVAQIGHTQGASGMASLLTAMQSLSELQAPATFGATTPTAPLAAGDSRIRLATTPSRLMAANQDGSVLAGVTSTDSLGAAYHLVLERGTKVPVGGPAEAMSISTATAAAMTPIAAAVSLGGRIVRIGAASVAEIQQRVAKAVENVAALFAGTDSVRFDAKDRCRLAIVTHDPADLAKKLTLAAQQLGTSNLAMLARKDIFFGQCTDPVGKVAFLFSGQGSQYPGMLKTLVNEFPPAAEALRRIEATLQRLNMPTFAEMAWEHGEMLGTDVWRTQLSLLCADTIVFQSLQALGIRPDCVAGHSYGEFPALVAAGAWDFENAVLGTQARCRAIEACDHVRGRMLSATASGPVIEKICREIEGRIYPANYNAPDQTVVGGEEDAIIRLAARLKTERIAAVMLRVPRPFHTPLMEDVKEPLARGLAPIKFRMPCVPMLSSITNRLVSSPEEIRANLIAQLVSPVRYVDLIEQLADHGVRALVEVGPRQVLTGLHGNIVAGRGVAAIASDDKTRSGVSRLLAVQACLESLGLMDRPTASPAVDVFASAVDASHESSAATSQIAEDSPAWATGSEADLLVLSGSPYEIGRQQGEAWADQIRQLARRYADLAGFNAQDAGDAATTIPTALGKGTVPFSSDENWDSPPLIHSPVPSEANHGLQDEEREELRGIAEGAGVSAEMLGVYNAWFDSVATNGAKQAAASSTDDAAELLHIFDERPASHRPWGRLALARGIRVYRPVAGFAHAVVSGPGVLGALAGVNEHGLAVSCAAISPPPTNRVGAALHTVLVRRLLQYAADPASAVELLRKATVHAGWEFCISHAATDLVCRVRFGEQSPQVESVARGAAIATHDRLGVVMFPRRREVVVRAVAKDRREIVRRYCLEPASSQPASVGHTQSASISAKPGVPFIPIEEYLAASQSVGERPPFDNAGRVCSRFVLRMLRTPIPEIEPSLGQLRGPAMIVGRNAVGMALRKQIEELGGKAVLVPISDDVEKTLAAVEKIWQAYKPLHLFLVTPFDEDATTSLEPADWQRRRQLGVMLPYLICQKWFSFISANKLVEQASVAAATSMGGDFGLSGHIEGVEGGAITGLIKALCIEFGYTTKWAFRAKVVDTPRNEPPQDVAAALLREIRVKSWFAEIGYAAGQRYVIGAIQKPTQLTHKHTPTRGRPWIVTGGARGITAAIARELASKFGVKLHLVGSSPRTEIDPSWHDLSPVQLKQLRAQVVKQALAENQIPAEAWKRVEKAIEIDKNLRGLAEAGFDTVYHACDVSDREAMAQLLEEIRQSDGPIEGVVHGAGIEVACRFTKKTLQNVSKTIAAKVDGAAVLMHLTRNDPLRFFFGFGSVSGRWGSIGQTDYALASDMLCKLVDWYRIERPECHATCFHWQPWDEIGMAVRNETRGSNMLQGLQLLPSEEGVEWFVEELLSGAAEPEVIVTDWGYYKRFHRDLSEKEVAETYSPTPAPAASDRVAKRHVMRMVEAPLAVESRRLFSFAGSALILGDNPDATALRERLEKAGVEVRQIAIRDSVEETLLEAPWMQAGSPAPHLFLMTGRDPDAAHIDSRDAWLRRRHRGVVLPFMVCQKWLSLLDDANLRQRTTLVAATSLGGDFGFAQPVIAPEGGALTGLLKCLYLELGGKKPGTMQIKIIDAPADEPPERLADAMLRELEIGGLDLEVACVRGQRHVVRLAIEPVESRPGVDIPRGGTWVFTGGARGITAAVAKELGHRYGLKLNLLGKSPAPKIDPAWLIYNDEQMRQLKRSLTQKAQSEGKPIGTYWDLVRKDLEIDRNLRELRAAGVQATYHCCDVTNWDELADTLHRIRAADGPIEGIVHGAGIYTPALTIDQTSFDIMAEMVGVKIDAMVALMMLTRDDPVRYLIGFGSISGRFGSSNASAYSLANDMQCKLIGWQRWQRPNCCAVGFHWHPWGDVGMMTRPVSQHTIKVMKMKMMPPDEGAAHLIEELRAGAPESEVLITDAQYYETFYSKDIILAVGDRVVPGKDCHSDQPAVAQAGGALIEQIAAFESGRQASVVVRLDPIQDPFLREHRLRDKATLPAVVALEAFAETATLLGGVDRSVVVGIRDVRIANAVRFFTDQPAEVRVHAATTDAGVECRLTSDFRNRQGQLVQKDRLHFSAIVELAAQPAKIDEVASELPDEWLDITYPTRDALMYHGLPLRLLKQVALGDSRGWGRIHMPAVNELVCGRNADGWLTPSAAIDASFYACGVYTWYCADHGVTVPDSLAELRMGRAARPSEQTILQLVCLDLQEKFSVFDFTLFGDDGAVIFQGKRYRCHVLRGGSP